MHSECGYPVPTGLMSPLTVFLYYRNNSIFNVGKGIHMESSVHCPSPPKTYSYVQEEKCGFNKKICTILLLFTCITNQISVLHPWSMNGLEEPF